MKILYLLGSSRDGRHLQKKNDYEMLVETEHIISSDKSYFICQIDLKAFLNNQLFHKKNWNEKITRKWQ